MEGAVLEVLTSKRRETSLYSVGENRKKLITLQGYHKVYVKSHIGKGGIKEIEEGGKGQKSKVDKNIV